MKVRSETAQFAGVTVSVELSLPLPEKSRLKTKSPEALIVPPFGHGPLYEIGMLQDSPSRLTVQSGNCE